MTSPDPENEDRGTDDRGTEDQSTQDKGTPDKVADGEAPELDYDAAFAALVARFGDVPEVEPADPAPSASGAGPAIGSGVERNPDAGTERHSYPPELDEHFEPPEPGPIPCGDLVSRLAWAGVLGGPAVLLVAAVAAGALPSLMVVAALLAFVGGFITLVARMPADRGDDGDDGAVV